MYSKQYESEVFMLKKGMFLNTILLLTLFLFLGGFHVNAEELSPELILSTGGDGANLKDKSHSTSYTFEEGATITVKATDNTPLSGIYIIWDSPAVEWTLQTDTVTLSCGQNGFLHEYISLDTPTASAVINISENNTRISDIRIFGEGMLPDDVQVWNPPCEKVDILLIPAHADDEILFLGGIIPTYAVVKDAQIQVAYMSEFWSSARIREHEKLDGLWEAGLRNYPVCGNFKDVYSETIEVAQEQYSLDDMVSYVTEQIRRFRPQVIVTHDQNGEYGHGFHMLTSKAVTIAVDAAPDASQYTDSASLYGTWDTPKTYLHLYGENKIRLDLRQPIEAMGGRTALEIAADAYKKHVSQQWCWFYVSDDYKYSCADFGLYRTTVGNDTTGDDLLENLITYKVQQEEEERKAAELEQQRLELERQQALQLQKEKELEEQRKLELELQQQEESRQKELELQKESELQQMQSDRLFHTILILLLVASASLALFITIKLVFYLRQRQRQIQKNRKRKR